MLETNWKYSTHQRVEVLLADGNDVFCTARHSWLIALDAFTGAERWAAKVKNAWGWLSATNTAVYYLNQHSNLVAFDRTSGSLLWSRELGGTYGWLHALGKHVVLGGWRGYTDVLCLSATDGELRWRYRSQGRALHSTRLHASTNTVVLSEPQDGGWIVFIGLDSGVEAARLRAPGAWSEETVERPPLSQPSSPLVLGECSSGFYLLTADKFSLDRVDVSQPIWSRGLSSEGDVVPYLTSCRSLILWSLKGKVPLALGHVNHNRRDLLPFCQLGLNTFAFGSSFGSLSLFKSGKLLAQKQVGKRVTTQLVTVGSQIVFGTASGDVKGETYKLETG